MLPIANRSGRTYRSPLREEQAEKTRDRILEAALRVIAGGLAGVSIPAVAREAGVSIPTIYRNFRTKHDLLEAIYPYAVRRANVGELRFPRSIEDFRDGVRVIFDRAEALDDLARAAIASPGAEEVRHATMGDRLAATRRVAAAIAPGLSTGDQERLTRLLIVLSQSASARMWRNHLGMSADEAADDVDWAVRAIVAGLRREAAE